jgi:AcrR family transcriptional regulator
MEYDRDMVNTTAGRPIDPSKDRDILAAGRKLLFGKGPQAVTMESVARAAGVAKPTLYRRYANRDELLAAIATAEAEAMSARFAQAPDSAEDLRRALLEFAVDLGSFLLSDEHVAFIHALGQATRLPRSARESIYRNGPLQTRDRLAGFLTEAARRGLILCPRPEASAERFLGMLMGLDLVRTLYHVAAAADADAMQARAQGVVKDFLTLHRPDPGVADRV